MTSPPVVSIPASTIQPVTENILKKCPSCGFTLPATPQHWYFDKKTGRIVGYCKGCKKWKVAERRREKKRGVPPKHALCSVCGDLRKVDWDDQTAVCSSCDYAWRAAGGTTRQAIAVLTWVVNHNKEVEFRRTLNTDVFLPHPDRLLGEYPAYDHRECLKAEQSARAVLRALTLRPQIA